MYRIIATFNTDSEVIIYIIGTIRKTFVYRTLLCSIFCSVFCSWLGFVVLEHDQCSSHRDKSKCNFGSYRPLWGVREEIICAEVHATCK